MVLPKILVLTQECRGRRWELIHKNVGRVTLVLACLNFALAAGVMKALYLSNGTARVCWALCALS